MSDPKNLLAPPDSEGDKNKKRKMTQAIIDDQEKEKEVYEFLEDDDDFEEFENDEVDYDVLVNQGGDVEMDTGERKGDDNDR